MIKKVIYFSLVFFCSAVKASFPPPPGPSQYVQVYGDEYSCGADLRNGDTISCGVDVYGRPYAIRYKEMIGSMINPIVYDWIQEELKKVKEKKEEEKGEDNNN